MVSKGTHAHGGDIIVKSASNQAQILDYGQQLILFLIIVTFQKHQHPSAQAQHLTHLPSLENGTQILVLQLRTQTKFKTVKLKTLTICILPFEMIKIL